MTERDADFERGAGSKGANEDWKTATRGGIGEARRVGALTKYAGRINTVNTGQSETRKLNTKFINVIDIMPVHCPVHLLVKLDAIIV